MLYRVQSWSWTRLQCARNGPCLRSCLWKTNSLQVCFFIHDFSCACDFHCFACFLSHLWRFVERRTGDIATCYADPSLANRELHWRAELGLERMCQDAWRWQTQNPQGMRCSCKFPALLSLLLFVCSSLLIRLSQWKTGSALCCCCSTMRTHCFVLILLLYDGSPLRDVTFEICLWIMIFGLLFDDFLFVLSGTRLIVSLQSQTTGQNKLQSFVRGERNY